MKNKKIAIPVFQNRISPLFDVSGNFRIFKVKNGIVDKEYSLDTANYSEKEIVDRLKDEDVREIVCSAISEKVASQVISNGIALRQGVVGSVDDIVYALLHNISNIDTFAMPGCRRRIQNKRRRHNKK